MQLSALQARLERLHAAPLGFAVADVLVADRATAEALAGTRLSTDEQLLLRQSDDTVEVALYLDQRVLATLAADSPETGLHAGNLEAWCLAVEGVSHLLHLGRHVSAQRPVSALELELLAEIEKFLLTLDLLRRQHVHTARELHRRFFDDVRWAAGLDVDTHDRYRHANRYAARWCQRALTRWSADLGADALVSELRWLARLDRLAKLRFIGGL